MSSINHFLGSTFHRSLRCLLSRSFFPLSRKLPCGMSYCYDLCRFLGTRNLPTIFDVGANKGQTVAELVHYFPRSTIYCIEPSRPSYKALKRRFRSDYIKCFNLGLGSEVGQLLLNQYSDSELNTFSKNAQRDGFLSQEIVDVTTIDEFSVSWGVNRIDLLKMDVQGWELNVLRGSERMLSNRQISSVLSEVSFDANCSDMQHFDEQHSFLTNNGFRLSGFYDTFRWGKAKEYLGFTNALYILNNQ